jgi:hypothetical protein
MAGAIEKGGVLQNFATAPEVIWEAFLGLWLTFRGFNRVALIADETSEVGTGVAAVVDAARAA